jgi:hypothetical protein
MAVLIPVACSALLLSLILLAFTNSIPLARQPQPRTVSETLAIALWLATS